KIEEDFKELSLKNQHNKSTAELIKQRKIELSQKLEDSDSAINNLIKNSEYESLSEVKDVLAYSINTVTEREEIEIFEKHHTSVKARIETSEKMLSGRTYDEEAHSSEIQKNTELKSQLNEKNNRLGGFINKLEELKEALNRKSELEKQLSALKLREENLKVLKNIFKSNGFTNYAATIYLRELCEAANARFRKLTRESLRLELDEDNNFIIRDYLNEGRTRSVKTLSGGQTFQAAFSLSLALADSIGADRSGFFFLDEGFGSLDRDSLSLVFDSLKSLKNENRTVGIISHVEELKQEIDTFISVKSDEENGSQITQSWEIS
ncbi:MAG: SbcC/MukB-like Walker B domain-containing protein, partial [Spirochaetales bacterium]|nr:SbcC/MukB-like Walker B domain-containing protein [Spirochaetales bacterium]